MQLNLSVFLTNKAFTLMELSIVLVILGLLSGGILVGRDLILASQVRAQFSQIVSFNTARYTFQSKYGYMPGDIKDPYATQFGFIPRGTTYVDGIEGGAQGDGDGVLMGVSAGPTFGNGTYISLGGGTRGELAVFWVDLSQAKLIKGSFTTASNTTDPGMPSTANYSKWWPESPFGGNIVIFTGGVRGFSTFDFHNAFDGINYFQTTRTIPVAQASALDAKMDDGLPQTGRVLASYTSVWPTFTDNGPSDTTTATPASSSSCYDDRGVTGSKRLYSVTTDGGRNVNCYLSFKFQ